MTDARPIACSLAAGELRRRLDDIAAVGAASLTNRNVDGGAHTLRFRQDRTTRRRLEEIIAAESECCAFLDLGLREDGDELVLTISAPAGGQPLAEQLALAFGGSKWRQDEGSVTT